MSRTYGRMGLRMNGDLGRWVIEAMEPHVCIRFKQLFPKILRTAAPPYVLPYDPPTCADLDWFLSRYPLAMEGADRDVLTRGREAFEVRVAEAERILSADYVAPNRAGWRPGHGPRGHQAATIELLALVGGLLVGDDVGEGKTFTTMGACMLPGALPATIVVDPHIQAQWAERFAQYTTLTTHCIRGTQPYALPPADVRIFRWTQLAGWADYFELLGTGLVGFDECQELRTGRASHRGLAADRLAASARLRLGLTATPIYNYGVEIWEVMRYLRPEVLGPRDDFIREWAPHGSVLDPKALGAFLREQHAFTRKRKAKDRVTRLVQAVGHDAASLASIEDIARELAKTAATGSFTERGEATRQLDLRVRQQTGIAKAKHVAAVVRILVESGTPLILAGWHREVYSIWLEELSDLAPAMYTGSESPAQKRREMARFLDGETDVFILSLRSGRGVDGLQARSKFVVIGELDWSPQVHHQIIGRLDREGSITDETDEDITALYLVAEDGSDPPMMDVLGLKASQSTGIVDPDLGVATVKTDGAGLKALVDRYLARDTNGVRPEGGGGRG